METLPTGSHDWWKWTAAILAAMILGLLPYIYTSSQFVKQDDLEHAVQVLEEQVQSKTGEILSAGITSRVEIAKLQAQIDDLIDRIEQLRALLASTH